MTSISSNDDDLLHGPPSDEEDEFLLDSEADEMISEAELAENLYAEGMAYYQRRQWRQALAAFSRLQELQPQRQASPRCSMRSTGSSNWRR